MNRRRLLKSISLVSGLTLVSGGGYLFATRSLRHEHLKIEKIIERLSSLDADLITSIGQWQPASILAHCRQSVEFSMLGYPLHRSELFKSVIGSAAFSTFSLVGKMKHNLAEPIPGAEVPKVTDTRSALEDLIQSLNRFDHYQGKLAPHFAFGRLSKSEYTLAHVMHINNHFDELVVTE